MQIEESGGYEDKKVSIPFHSFVLHSSPLPLDPPHARLQFCSIARTAARGLVHMSDERMDTFHKFRDWISSLSLVQSVNWQSVFDHLFLMTSFFLHVQPTTLLFFRYVIRLIKISFSGNLDEGVDWKYSIDDS